MFRIALTVVFVALLAALGGCNTGDLPTLGSSSSSPSSSSSGGNASAAGIWTGVDSASGMAMTAFIDSSGNADFILANGVQYTGTVQVAGTNVAISVEGYPQFGSQFSDTSTYGVGTFNGTVSTGSSLTGTLSFTTSDNTMSTSDWSLTFSSLYDTASPLSAVSGTYTESSSAVSAGLDPLAGATVTISSSGALSGHSPTTGCALNGTLTNSNPSNDLFTVSYTYESCTGSYAGLNGVQFTGLADNDPNSSPAQVVIGATAQSSSGSFYAVVLALNHS